MTDGLSSYPPAIQEVLPNTVHDTSQYANNRAQSSHQHTRAAGNDRCKASNLCAKRSDFLDSMVASATCFDMAVT